MGGQPGFFLEKRPAKGRRIARKSEHVDKAYFAKAILTLISIGFSEKEILEWSLDKFGFYLESAAKWEAEKRIAFVQDVMAGIGSALSKDGFSKYEKAMRKFT